MSLKLLHEQEKNGYMVYCHVRMGKVTILYLERHDIRTQKTQ